MLPPSPHALQIVSRWMPEKEVPFTNYLFWLQMQTSTVGTWLKHSLKEYFTWGLLELYLLSPPFYWVFMTHSCSFFGARNFLTCGLFRKREVSSTPTGNQAQRIHNWRISSFRCLILCFPLRKIPWTKTLALFSYSTAQLTYAWWIPSFQSKWALFWFW